MRVARVAAAAALVIAVGIVAYLLLRGDGGTRYTVRLINAGQLVKGDDVQVGVRRIGSIDDIELTDDNQAEIKITVEEAFAPLRQGTTAIVRATSLSGIANRYIALTPAPGSADPIPDGGQLKTEKTTSIVDLDQLFNTLDEKTRRSLQLLIQGFSTQYDGKEQQANDAIKYFNPAISSTTALARELTADQPTLQRFLVDTSNVMSTIAQRRNDLAGLITNTNSTAGAIAAERASLSQTLQQLPATLRKANTSFVNLRSTLTDLTALVDETKPVAPRLAPFFRALRPLVSDARPTVRDLRRLIREQGSDNDAIDLLNKTPRLARLAAPTFSNTVKTLRRAQPVVEYIRPYAPEFISWLRDFGQTPSTYDANGHYARIQPVVNLLSVDDQGVLNPIVNSEKFAGTQTHVQQRCPGSSSQPPIDGSAPFTDNGNLTPRDCNPALVPPGP